MLIPFKHDSANGEMGVSDAFAPGERVAAEAFRRQVLTDPGYVPDGLGTVPAFESLIAGFYLEPERRIAGLMWIYRDWEGLRRSLYFTIFRLPLETADPYRLAASIENGLIPRERIGEAVAAGRFELEVKDGFAGGGVEAAPAGLAEVPLRELSLVTGADLHAASGRAFFPFITVRPLAKEKASAPAKPRRREPAAVSVAAEDSSVRTGTVPYATDEAKRWRTVSYLLLGIVLGGLLAGGFERMRRPPSDWEAERSEMGQDIKALRADVSGLREEVTKLRQEMDQPRGEAATQIALAPGLEVAPSPTARYIVNAVERWLRTDKRTVPETEMTLLPRDTIVEVIREEGIWARVSVAVEGRPLEGFMRKDGLKKIAE